MARFLSGLGALLLAAGLLAGCQQQAQAPRFHATVLDNPGFAEDFRLQDPDGKERSLADWRGKVVLLFFGYTQCPDVCPTALSRAARVMELLGADADRVQVLFVTVDPARDTAELLKEYPTAFHPSFLGLRTSVEKTAEVAKQFRVFYRINPGSTPSTYTIDHSVTTYAYDPQGKLRLAIGHDATAEAVAEDIRTLLGSRVE
ncbi:MAG: SCO family protein [Azovibrio sp.]|nr:SCO family protein [Azovibrio sp.]